MAAVRRLFQLRKPPSYYQSGDSDRTRSSSAEHQKEPVLSSSFHSCNSCPNLLDADGNASDIASDIAITGNTPPSTLVKSVQEYDLAANKVSRSDSALDPGVTPRVLGFNHPRDLNGYLSPFYSIKFVDDNNITYNSVDQYIQAEKANFFKDQAIRKKIIESQTPEEIEKLTRSITNYQEKIWDRHKFVVALRGTTYKFNQNLTFRRRLLDTKNMILGYLVPDVSWGTGTTDLDQRNWIGENLYGQVLMVVREKNPSFV